jgi:hypothetical protein
MDILKKYTELMSFFCEQLRREVYGDRRRLEVLAWGVIGLLSCQRVALSEWGEVVSSRAQFASSHERRFARWLANPHLKVQPYYTPLLKAALATWPKTQRLRLALDTAIPGGRRRRETKSEERAGGRAKSVGEPGAAGAGRGWRRAESARACGGGPPPRRQPNPADPRGELGCRGWPGGEAPN